MDEILQPVKLEIQTGEPVGVTGKIPRFSKPPDVLFWGTRVFEYDRTVDDMLIYRECFSFALVQYEVDR